VAALALALVFLPWRALLAAAGADSYRAGRMMEIVGRSLRVFPLELALCVAVAAVRPLAAAASSRWKPRAERALLALLLVFAVLGPAMRLRLKAEYGPMMRPRFEYIYAGKPAILGLPAGTTVVSDAWTSYMTQNALGCYCVTTPAGHSSSLVDVRERSRAIGLLFGGKLPAAEAGAFLRRHGGGYVLVNKRLASGAPIPNFEYKAAEYDGYRPENLDALPFVAKEYEDNDVALYRVVM
jgi:hypothetical protein